MRSERLGFGEWTPDDLDVARGLWGDARVTHLIGGPFTEGQVRDRLSAEIESLRAHGVQYWPVFRLEDDAHVGCCGLRPCPGRADTLELGFQLRPESWGAGLASEAAATVIRHAFTVVRAGALFAGHHPENHASRAVLQKLGFRHTHDELYAPTGRNHPSYRLGEEEWASRNPDGPRPVGEA